jgi:hypothetical protein
MRLNRLVIKPTLEVGKTFDGGKDHSAKKPKEFIMTTYTATIKSGVTLGEGEKVVMEIEQAG